MHRLGVSLLAYSPLAYGLLTGKYDKSGITGPDAPAEARITRYESVRKLRWGRPDALKAARLYNQLARDNGGHRCLRHHAVAGNPGRDRQDPLGHPGPGGVSRRAVPRPERVKKVHVSETPATQLLRANGSPSPSTRTSTWSTAARSTAPRCWGFDPFTVVKTLVMEDEKAGR
jgi:hypothetical protein